jgi:hypothetical protein
MHERQDVRRNLAKPGDATYEEGSHWHGETFRQGTVEDTRVYHDDGHQEHCHGYMVGMSRYTTCDS